MFVCVVCSKSFSLQENLIRHAKTHEAPSYDCNDCTASFSHEHLLTRHLQNDHELQTAEFDAVVGPSTSVARFGSGNGGVSDYSEYVGVIEPYDQRGYETPSSMNTVYHHLNSTKPANDFPKMSNCIAKMKGITVSGTNLFEGNLRDSSVDGNMHVKKDPAVPTEAISTSISDSTNIQVSVTMSRVKPFDVRLCEQIFDFHLDDMIHSKHEEANILNDLDHYLNCIKPNIEIQKMSYCPTNSVRTLENSASSTEENSPCASNSVLTHHEIKPAKCPVCDMLFEVNCYKEHIQSAEHKSASNIKFKDKIDFKTNVIFADCTSIDQYLGAISENFNILLNHLLLLNNVILIDLKFSAGFYKINPETGRRSVVVSPYIFVENKEVTKNTDLKLFYDFIVKCLMSLYGKVLAINSGWALERIIHLDIITKERKNETQPKLVVACPRESNETGSTKKTVPLRMTKCEICNLSYVENNYEQHAEIVSHRIALMYLRNQKILINPEIDNLKGCFLNCRFIPESQMPINTFLSSIESELLLLTHRILEINVNSSIKVDLKLFVVYNPMTAQSGTGNLGTVKMFTIDNMVIRPLHPYTSLLSWYHHVTTAFDIKNKNHLRENQPYHLICSLYLDIDFYVNGIYIVTPAYL